MSKIEN
ncbi:hypothetical protein D047_0795A, partial [Vibrio parahaemolyticus VPTS-2010_2]